MSIPYIKHLRPRRIEDHEPSQVALDRLHNLPGNPPATVPDLIRDLETRLVAANAAEAAAKAEWTGKAPYTHEESIAWGYYREKQGIVLGLRAALDLARGER